MRLKKQSLRQISDAAAIDRRTALIEAIGTIVTHEAVKRNDAQNKPKFFRGALIKPR
jgi:hypothetical protein